MDELRGVEEYKQNEPQPSEENQSAAFVAQAAYSDVKRRRPKSAPAEEEVPPGTTEQNGDTIKPENVNIEIAEENKNKPVSLNDVQLEDDMSSGNDEETKHDDMASAISHAVATNYEGKLKGNNQRTADTSSLANAIIKAVNAGENRDDIARIVSQALALHTSNQNADLNEGDTSRMLVDAIVKMLESEDRSASTIESIARALDLLKQVANADGRTKTIADTMDVLLANTHADDKMKTAAQAVHDLLLQSENKGEEVINVIARAMDKSLTEGSQDENDRTRAVAEAMVVLLAGTHDDDKMKTAAQAVHDLLLKSENKGEDVINAIARAMEKNLTEGSQDENDRARVVADTMDVLLASTHADDKMKTAAQAVHDLLLQSENKGDEVINTIARAMDKSLTEGSQDDNDRARVVAEAMGVLLANTHADDKMKTAAQAVHDLLLQSGSKGEEVINAIARAMDKNLTEGSQDDNDRARAVAEAMDKLLKKEQNRKPDATEENTPRDVANAMTNLLSGHESAETKDDNVAMDVAKAVTLLPDGQSQSHAEAASVLLERKVKQMIKAMLLKEFARSNTIHVKKSTSLPRARFTFGSKRSTFLKYEELRDTNVFVSSDVPQKTLDDFIEQGKKTQGIAFWLQKLSSYKRWNKGSSYTTEFERHMERFTKEQISQVGREVERQLLERRRATGKVLTAAP